MSEKWLTGKVVENRHWTEEAVFAARGRRAARLPGRPVRAHRARTSMVSAWRALFRSSTRRGIALLEFYGVIVPQGPLSPRLAQLERGRRALCGAESGRVPDPVRRCRTPRRCGSSPPARASRRSSRSCAPKRPGSASRMWCVVHAVRYANELTYRERDRRQTPATLRDVRQPRERRPARSPAGFRRRLPTGGSKRRRA